MKRLRVHVSVSDLDASARFYSRLFARCCVPTSNAIRASTGLGAHQKTEAALRDPEAPAALRQG